MKLCPSCNSDQIVKRGKESGKQRYSCKACGRITVNPLESNREAPEGYVVKGQSVLYDELGNVKLTWEKVDRDKQHQFEMIKAAVNELCENVKPIKPSLPPLKTNQDYLTVYPFGDPHIGLHAWHEEAGEDYDLAIAEDLFTQAMLKAVDKAPPSTEALIINVGDFFHSDNMENRTRRSGNALDVDTRYNKVIRAGVRIMQTCIAHALTQHEVVTVVNAIGNHDEHSSQWLAIALDARYADEPRVQINVNPAQFQYTRFGLNLIGVTHGDTIKPQDLESIMAADKPEDWGSTKFRYWYTGHVHHDQIKEYRGCKFESFRTLAAKDAWHAGAGYRSGRDLKVIVLHKYHGEVERYTISIEQFKGAA